jgi:hypothetical protein
MERLVGGTAIRVDVGAPPTTHRCQISPPRWGRRLRFDGFRGRQGAWAPEGSLVLIFFTPVGVKSERQGEVPPPVP